MKRLLRFFRCVTITDGQGAKFLQRYYILKTPILSVYIHHWLKDDEADMHDHPWPFLILVLKQGYREILPSGPKIRKPWRVFGHLPTCKHRIELIDNKPSWSLVIMGPKVREWGFHTKLGWIPFKKYVTKKFEKGCE